MQLPDFDWIFFDCFNTLIDDFDSAGEEGSLLCVPQMAVERGYFPTVEEFRAVYAKIREQSLKFGRETVLAERLRQTLQEAPAKRTRDECVATAEALLAAWETEYAKLLRPAPGVREMLDHWYARRSLAVVTNSLVAGLPQRQLERFGLRRYFRFVLDSATHGFKKPTPCSAWKRFRWPASVRAMATGWLDVGDRLEVDAAAAADLGMHVLHFNRSRTRPGVAPSPEGTLAIQDWSEFR
jgi:putative hydrolase of the HAD superfamily